jgi:hypothetical protein
MIARFAQVGAAALLAGGSLAVTPVAFALEGADYPPTTPAPTATAVAGVKTPAPVAPAPAAPAKAVEVQGVKLAPTGANAGEWVAIGGAFLLVGGAIVVGSRARRRT